MDLSKCLLLLLSYKLLMKYVYCGNYENYHFNQIHERNVILGNSLLLRRLEEAEVMNWTKLLEESIDVNRESIARDAVANGRGVYRNFGKARKIGTENTVLVNVLAFSMDAYSERYMVLLQNWYCYASHYGLKTLTYLVPDMTTNFTDQVRILKSFGIVSDFLTYPVTLFWETVSKKATGIHGGGGRNDYAGGLPSFAHFGALTMLVPILEVLDFGFDAIYLDLDLAFIHDPIPNLILGISDFSVSIEMRTCLLPSVLEIGLVTNWQDFEPNTGVMRVRSTKGARDLYRKWLQRIVDTNVANDQKVLDFEALGAELSFDCNRHLRDHSAELLQLYDPKNKMKDPNPPKYCFLNEFEYQNGKIALECAFNRGGSVLEYIVGMYEQNITSLNETSGQIVRQMSPTIVHFNYCNDKFIEMEKLQVWLPLRADNYHAQSCKNYRYEDTYYGGIDYDEKYRISKIELDQIRSILYNGSLIKMHRRPQVYIYRNDTLPKPMFIPFPDGDTFEAMGFQWKDVHYPGAFNFLRGIWVAEEFPQIKLP